MNNVNAEGTAIPKILIGVPILSWTHEFATSFLRFWTELMTYHSDDGLRFHVAYDFMYRKPVHMAEEQLVENAIRAGCTHVLMMDDDIYDVTANDFVTLLKADKDVVGGIMHTGGFPHSICAFRRYNLDTRVADQPLIEGAARLYEIPLDQRTGLQEVDLLPFAFALFKLSIFEKIKKPWFTCNTQAPTDSWFADAAMDNGIKIYACFDVWLNHRGVTRDNVYHWRQLGALDDMKKKAGRVITLTQEEMLVHEKIMAEKLKTAEEKRKQVAVDQITFYEKSNDSPIGVPVRKTANIGTNEEGK